MKILISACLMGVACRYDAKSKPCEGIENLMEKHTLIPFCPEVYGGLPTPRFPSEIIGERVVNSVGEDVSEQYEKGAREALAVAQRLGCTVAVLKAKSPSCGKGLIYDGSFSGKLTSGNGITARLFLDNGISVYTEEEIRKL